MTQRKEHRMHFKNVGSKFLGNKFENYDHHTEKLLHHTDRWGTIYHWSCIFLTPFKIFPLKTCCFICFKFLPLKTCCFSCFTWVVSDEHREMFYIFTRWKGSAVENGAQICWLISIGLLYEKFNSNLVHFFFFCHQTDDYKRKKTK